MSTETKTPVVRRETKNSISVDYEGKMSFADRLKNKLKESNTWILAGVNVLKFILMLGVSFVILHPFIAKIAASFMTKEDVIDATIGIIPKHPTLEIYKAIIVENLYFEAFLNTLLMSLMCAVIQTLIAAVVGYGLAKFKFRGNKLLMVFVIVTMVIPNTALQTALTDHFESFDLGVVQSFGYEGILQLINGGKDVDLTHTFLPMLILSLSGLALKNGLYIYMMNQFYKGIPDELEESAYVDGSGVFRTFVQIIIPLSVPMMITIFLFSFSWQWTDEFYDTVFFAGNDPVTMMPDIITTPPSLAANYAGTALYENVIRNTAGMMVIAPLIIMYLFCQRYLVEGIERSGIVG